MLKQETMRRSFANQDSMQSKEEAKHAEVSKVNFEDQAKTGAGVMALERTLTMGMGDKTSILTIGARSSNRMAKP